MGPVQGEVALDVCVEILLLSLKSPLFVSGDDASDSGVLQLSPETGFVSSARRRWGGRGGKYRVSLGNFSHPPPVGFLLFKKG